MTGPPLAISLKLASSQMVEYAERAASLKQRYPDRYAMEQAAIEAVLAQTDHERRLERWLSEYLRNTAFDNPLSKMGNPGLKPQGIADVVAWIMADRAAR
jgi:hypothetical protein